MDKKELSIEEKVAGWKKLYGDVFEIKVGTKKEDTEELEDIKVAYLKRPSRKALGAAAVLGKNDPMKYNEVLLNNCWIEGDEEIKTDDALFLGASAQLAELIEIKEASLKKL